MLRVNEVFGTIQGEASWAGTPSVFVRLQGCDVGCPWCDTKYTWPDSFVDGSRDDVFERSGMVGGFDWDDAELLAAIMERFQSRHIVLTGGEPLQQDADWFCEMALGAGYSVQVETSGTYERRLPPDVFVTVSPKVGMPGRRVVSRAMLKRADEIKFPIGKMSDIQKLQALLPETNGAAIWLQPLSMSAKATALCIEQCVAHNWRLSIQVHKFLGVR